MLLDNIQKDWVKMFESIDLFITKTIKMHPEMDQYLDREPIKKAVHTTVELLKILEEAKEVSNERKNKTNSK